jgi:hypothetical protein
MPSRRPPSRPPRFAIGDQPVQRPACITCKPFRNPPRHRQHQRHHHVGGVLGHDAGRVRHQDAALPRRRHVDMVETRAIVGDQLQLLARLRQQARVDHIGDRRHQHIRPPHRLGQLLAGHRDVRVAQFDVEQLLHPRFDGLGQPSRHDHSQVAGRHA